MRDGVTTGRKPPGGEGPGGRWLPEGGRGGFPPAFNHISKKRGGSRKAAGAKGPRPLVSPAAEAGILAGAGPRVGNDAPEQSGGGGRTARSRAAASFRGAGPPEPSGANFPPSPPGGVGAVQKREKRGAGVRGPGDPGGRRVFCAPLRSDWKSVILFPNKKGGLVAEFDREEFEKKLSQCEKIQDVWKMSDAIFSETLDFIAKLNISAKKKELLSEYLIANRQAVRKS